MKGGRTMSKMWKTDELLSSENFNAIEEGVAEINDDYVPYDWKAGDVITANRLNAIEQGIANASGGGNSDFTTATLYLTNNLSDIVEFAVPNIWTDPETLNHSDAVVTVDESATETVTVVMYKGIAMCHVLTPLGKFNEATATGSIAGVSPNFEIHGNGTITVAEKSE
jgi:hypothetical protein